MFLEYGKGPNQCDTMNAREAMINYVDGTYYLYYDGAGAKGWVSCLAVSKDLKTWERKGPLLEFGPGSVGFRRRVFALDHQGREKSLAYVLSGHPQHHGR